MTEQDQAKGGFGPKQIAVAALAALVIGGFIFYLNLGSIVKTVAERVGSETLGTKVSIGSIDIKAMDKTVTVRDVRIANPAGYSKPYAMKIELINIAAETLSKELLVFNDVTVKGSELFLEVTSKGTNLSALKKNVDQGKKAPAKTAPSKEGEAPKIILKHFLLSGAKLHPTATLAGGDMKSVTMPDIKLTGIGQKQKGVLAKEAVGQIWDKVSTTAVQASANAGFLQGLSPDALKDISGSIKLPKDLSGGISGGSIKKATEGLKGIFGQ